MSGAGHGKPDPEGHHDDLDQADLEGLSLLVPDDARSLDADRLAYLEELREQARHGWRRMVFTRRWVRFGLSGPLVTLVLVGVTIVGSLMVVFAPKPQPVPGPAPLAVGAPGQVGEVGGLLPAESVMANGLEVALRSVRPAVFVLVPRDCPECNTIIRSIYSQAREYRLRLALVGTAGQEQQITRIDRIAATGGGIQIRDASGVLWRTYSATGVTLLLVHSDGIVGAVARDIAASTRLESALVQLTRPGMP